MSCAPPSRTSLITPSNIRARRLTSRSKSPPLMTGALPCGSGIAASAFRATSSKAFSTASTACPGRCWRASRGPGWGCSSFIRLPGDTAVVPLPKARGRPGQYLHHPASARLTSKLMGRILIVEDETHLAEGLRFNLEAEGYAVDVVTDGETAVRLLLAAAGQYDAVVLDVMLPGKDGFAVAAELRQAEQF